MPAWGTGPWRCCLLSHWQRALRAAFAITLTQASGAGNGRKKFHPQLLPDVVGKKNWSTSHGKNLIHFSPRSPSSEGHPDKVCDRISDAVLDAMIAVEPEARVAAETFATTNQVVIGGEIGLSDPAKLATMMGEIDQIARDCIRDIGYEQEKISIGNIAM